MVLRTRDVRGAGDTLEIPDGARLVHLILVASAPSYPVYRLEIRDPATNSVLWTGGGLKATGDPGMLSVALPREVLPTGELHLRLSGLDADEAVALEEYALEIRDRSPAGQRQSP